MIRFRILGSLPGVLALASLVLAAPARAKTQQPGYPSDSARKASAPPPAPPDVPVASPAAAKAAALPVPAGPCASAIGSIRPGTVDPEPFLAAAACLRKSPPSSPSPSDTSAPASPAQGADAALKRVLPPSENWYVAQLERFRARRDMERLKDMAFLAALRDPSGPDVWRQIAESHAMMGDPYHGAWAQLKQAEKDSSQGGYIQYQIESMLRSATEPPAPVILDSLTAGFKHAKAVTAEVLEGLCWQNRVYGTAYRNTLAWLALAKPGPGPALDRAGRYHLAGWPDHAAGILERIGWRAFPQPHRNLGRALFLRVAYQLEDWPSITAEAAKAPKGTLSEEEDHIFASAALRQGRPQDALARLERFESQGESPWGYRAQFLKARALLALNRLPEASRLLDELKKSPKRREASGPILFWQGWLALQQGREVAAESLLVLASAYTGTEESQRALEYRYWMLMDSGGPRREFFRGLAESPLAPAERIRSLDRVPGNSSLWVYARIEKGQILASQGLRDSARAVLDEASRLSQDPLAGLKAEALAAYLQEKEPGGRAAALARYEDLLIKYQQGVVPEFSRGRIRALK